MPAPLPCDGTGRRILEEVQAAHPEATDAVIARWCGGVDASLVARWRAGDRAMPAWVLGKLIKKSGNAPAVLGELAAIGGYELVRVPLASAGGRDLLRQAAGLTGAVGRLASELADATDPESEGGNDLTAGERAGVLAELDAAMCRLAQLRADVEGKPRVVA